MVRAGRAHGGDNNDWDGRYGGRCQVLMNPVDLRSSSIVVDANSTSSATLNAHMFSYLLYLYRRSPLRDLSELWCVHVTPFICACISDFRQWRSKFGRSKAEHLILPLSSHLISSSF
jgi:hypothetical protein